MKKIILMTTAVAAALSAHAQMIDFDLPGKTTMGKDTELNYTSWAVPRASSDTKSFDNGVSITITAGGAASAVGSNWNKTYVESKGLRVIADEVVACNLVDGNMVKTTEGSSSLILTITGLSAGAHTLKAYHNNSDLDQSMPDVEVRVNGQVVASGKPFTSGAESTIEAGSSYITFTAKEGEPVVITYATTPESGKTYSTTSMMLNGLEFDVAAMTATDPTPSNQDYHAGQEDGTVQFSWTAAVGAVAHKLVLGTDSAEVAQSDAYLYEGENTSFTQTGLSSMQRYWWRIDEVDAEGNIYRGTPWSFRPCHLAFPGAEGYGRYALGGRGGSVYHVTNLNNDHNPGSLLYGLTDISEPHTIVFDVSGIIVMDFSAVFTNPYITIAGQTAPGKGICLKASNVNIGSDNICRFMRFKHGYGDTGNAMGMSGANHSIVDHTTAAWGTDETVSGRGALNVSFQYSMIAEALGIADHKNYSAGTNHGYAATIDGRIGSWHHNLLLNCEGRNWSMGGGMDGQNRPIGGLDLFNNVCYNWHSRTTDGNCHAVNFVNNYYKMGADTNKKILFSQDFEDAIAPDGVDQAYVSGNIRENKNHTLTYDKKGETYKATGNIPTTYKYLVDEPLFASYATIHTAKDALKIVTSDGGATMPMRDDQHLRVIREAIEGTYTYTGSRSGIKGEIDHEDDAGGWEVYPEEHRSADFDTDQDGMPNWYEKVINSDINTANHNDDPDNDGYTLLEDYLDFMAHPYLIVAPNESKTINMKPYFRGFYGFNGETSEPVYSITSNSPLFVATVSDSIITVQAKEEGGIGMITVKVTDTDGASFEQQLGIAITGETTGIHTVWNEDQIEVAKREFFTLDGKKVDKFDAHNVYVMKITDTTGKVYSMKVIKN
ncbi:MULTISPECIES: hypothetical protein [Segatella]|uniref:Uncharacterized protein n=2 Tax=Segatella TaxID=2974251 RepID=D8DW10_9BACT|nr:MULTISPECIES: hypothetical protein [Segatella]EFI72389.1 conserved hypothetical protein [Segatella baroniae B14]UKK78017.1 hypothetical protein L6469_09735 [Segatella baroniae B14]GJG27696.1 hypothetical protein PRRU23_13960 [Segatella bryantii]SEP85208.1 hypothetical protein SAMN05444375_103118 [Segatella baroniae B14]